jgi:glycosyltransferase involved in cell wall biosynthesis
MNPRYPLYIVSKSRADSRMTSKALERMNVPYHIVVEQQQFDMYAAVIDPKKILILDKRYQDEYDTFDSLGYAKSKGPGAARNFAWAHSMAAGFEWHWVMDDNIRSFERIHQNQKIELMDGTGFRCMEDFVLRYKNVAMAGPNYSMFVPRKKAHIHPPFVLNTRIYSCNMIRNDVPFRWRGRYNEDTDLSLVMLKAGWCTIQFNAFTQEKIATQIVKGGNDADFYSKEGTGPKSEMLKAMHPDVTELVIRFGRKHHLVDYSRFKANVLKRAVPKESFANVDGDAKYGLKIVAAKARRGK